MVDVVPGLAAEKLVIASLDWTWRSGGGGDAMVVGASVCKTLRRGMVRMRGGKEGGIDGEWPLLRPDDRPGTGERTVR